MKATRTLNRFIFLLTCALAISAWADPNDDLIAALGKRDFQEATRIFSENEKTINADHEVVVEGIRATVLLVAAVQGHWRLVTRMLELNPKANVDATIAEGPIRGSTVLWFAAKERQWPLVSRMLELNPKANVDAAPAEGPSGGATVLWFAAGRQQWPLVTRMLELNPKANVDATMAEGPARDVTVLWLAAKGQQWPLVTRMLELNPKANVDAAPAEGPSRGATVLWFAAERQQWPLVTRMLLLNPSANISARPAEGPDKDKDVIWYVRQGLHSPMQKFLVIQEMSRDVEGRSLESRLKQDLGMLVGPDLIHTFRKATVAFTNMIDDSGVGESSALDQMPAELKVMFVLRYLRVEDPDLVDVPDGMLLTLLGRFHKVYKDVDYKGRSIEVVAAKVLHRLAPIQNREDISDNRIKTIKKVRGWIIAEITDAMKANVLPQTLDQDLREQLAASLSSKSLSTITRLSIKETISTFAEQQRREQAPEAPDMKKREGDQERDEPNEDESAPKAQTPQPL